MRQIDNLGLRQLSGAFSRTWVGVVLSYRGYASMKRRDNSYSRHFGGGGDHIHGVLGEAKGNAYLMSHYGTLHVLTQYHNFGA
mgnify:CR=1 FL=1